MEEKILELYAFASSLEEEKKHRAKFPALAVRKVTDKAQKQGAFRYSGGDYDGNGWRYLRTAVAGSAARVKYMNIFGNLDWSYGIIGSAGVCVAFRPIYDPKSSVVTRLKTQDFTSIVYNAEKNKRKKVTSKDVPIIAFGGKEYIVYNLDECEEAFAHGETIAMDCESLYLEERAEAFDKTGKSNDYAVATKQQKQYERILLENATEEEKSLLCKVRMSSKDNYESLEIIMPENQSLTKEQRLQQILEKIEQQRQIVANDQAILKDLYHEFILVARNSLNEGAQSKTTSKDEEAE